MESQEPVTMITSTPSTYAPINKVSGCTYTVYTRKFAMCATGDGANSASLTSMSVHRK